MSMVNTLISITWFISLVNTYASITWLTSMADTSASITWFTLANNSGNISWYMFIIEIILLVVGMPQTFYCALFFLKQKSRHWHGFMGSALFELSCCMFESDLKLPRVRPFIDGHCFSI